MNVNLVASLSGSGYGVVGLQILKSIEAIDHEVTFFPRTIDRVAPFSLDLRDVALVARCVRRQRDMDISAPCLRISIESDMTLFAGRGPRCGLAFFETTRFSDVELRHLGSLDLLVVASGWARSVALDNGFAASRVVVAPMGVDREIFHETVPPEGGSTVFLNVGKWEHREGQDVLLDAFGRAFRPGDNGASRAPTGSADPLRSILHRRARRRSSIS